MHARYYDPKPGRFLSADRNIDVEKAIHFPQKWNRYAYALNNPIRYVGPNGRQEYDPNCSGCGIVPSPSLFGVQVLPSFHEDDLIGQGNDAISRQIQQTAVTATNLFRETAIMWGTMFIGPLEAAPSGLIAGRAAVEAGGFRFTEFYLSRLVSTGRANAAEVAEAILKAGVTEFEPIAVSVGPSTRRVVLPSAGDCWRKTVGNGFNPKTKRGLSHQRAKED